MTTEMFEGPDGLLYANPAECADAWAHEATSLRAALAEAERDAARYRWIRDCLWSPIKDEMELQIGPLYFLQSDYQPKDIDWTIDAAMATNGGKVE